MAVVKMEDTQLTQGWAIMVTLAGDSIVSEGSQRDGDMS